MKKPLFFIIIVLIFVLSIACLENVRGREFVRCHGDQNCNIATMKWVYYRCDAFKCYGDDPNDYDRTCPMCEPKIIN